MSPERLEQVRNQSTGGEDSHGAQSEREAGTAAAQVKKPKKQPGHFLQKKCSSAPPKQRGTDMEPDSYLLTVTADSESDPLERRRLHCSHVPRVSHPGELRACIQHRWQYCHMHQDVTEAR